MSQTELSRRLHRPVGAALLMTAAGLAFAGLNVAVQWATMVAGAPPTAAAFWQYAIALALCIPLMTRQAGFARTRYPGLHILRAICAAAGVQVWVAGLATVPIWQAVALSMTSPFFVIAGAVLFLRESASTARLLAAIAGFAGAMIILAPWSSTFSLHALLPIAAAALWAGASIITKKLTAHEPASGIAVYMLLLLLPFNAVVWAGDGFAMPPTAAWTALIIAGAATALGQYLLTAAYSRADATYLQPFDDLKLPLNMLLGWAVFHQTPDLSFWPGAALIVAASLSLMRRER
ncbi:MAG: DMT family transporter [Mesorhizobium sp.]